MPKGRFHATAERHAACACHTDRNARAVLLESGCAKTPDPSLPTEGHPDLRVPSLLTHFSGFSFACKLGHGPPSASSLGHVPTLLPVASALLRESPCLDALLHRSFWENPHSDMPLPHPGLEFLILTMGPSIPRLKIPSRHQDTTSLVPRLTEYPGQVSSSPPE